MSDTEMNSGEEESHSSNTHVSDVERMVEQKIQRSLESHKGAMLKEIGSMFEKISEHTNISQLSKISNIMACDIPKFKRKSNEEQYRHNAKVSSKLCEAEQLAGTSHEQCKAKIAEAKDMIVHRHKLIQLADSSELGWRVVNEYETNPLVDDSEDEKRIYKAEARANRKLKAERAKKTKSSRPTPYRRPVARTQTTQAPTPVVTARPGLCFKCGKVGHWKRECPGIPTNNKMSIYSNKFATVHSSYDISCLLTTSHADIFHDITTASEEAAVNTQIDEVREASAHGNFCHTDGNNSVYHQ